MANLKPSVADAMQVTKTPTLANDAVRLADLQGALANVPTVGQMSSAIAYVAQGPTNIESDNSLLVNILGPNSFQITARLAPPGVLQSAATGLTGTQSIVSAWTEIVLGYQQVSSVVVTRNLIAGGAVTFTGVQGVDYYLDAFNGLITITPISGLINSSESPQTTQIKVSFNCAEIDSGGGLCVVGGSSGGLEVKWGEGHDEVPHGDTVAELLENMHLPAAPDPAAQTTTTTVDELQRIRTEVILAPNGGITALPSSGGLEVNMPAIIAAVEAAIPNASSSSTGFMTPAQVAALGALEGELPAVWGETNSTQMQQDQYGNVTTNVLTGQGITIGYVTATGNTGLGLFGGENIWYDLSLSPTNWPAGWPNVLFWAITVAAGTITFSIYSDSGGSNLLASGTLSVSGLLAAATPQFVTLYNPSSIIVGSVAVNTAVAYPVTPSQEIVLTAQGVSADLTVLALRSTTDAQQLQIDQLESQSSSNSSAIAGLENEVGTLGQNLLTPANINDFNCLSTLLEKWEFAHRLVPSLRLELPNLAAGSAPAPAMVPQRQIYCAGTSAYVYSVSFQVAGVCQLKYYWQGGAVAGTSNGRCVQNGTPYDVADPRTSPWPPSGWPPAGQPDILTTIERTLQTLCDLSLNNTWALIISDDGTGTQQTYYLNAALNDADQNGGPQVLNYTITGINIKGGATATLLMVSAGSATVHQLVVPDAGPFPASFPGYFMQVDAIGIADVCPIGDIAADGGVDGIGVFGSTIRKDLGLIDGGPTGANDSSANYYPALNASPEQPGFNGPAALGTNGNDIPTGNGQNSTANQPVIDLPRDLLRLGLMDGGNADDWVYDILINGNDIWVAGAFSRWGNTPCPGLVRLDHLGRLAYDYNNFRASFSEPVRHIALTSDGNIMAASVFGALYQNNLSSPVHKILRDGTEDSTFVAPDQMAINDTAHPNLIIDVACLSDGKVAVLTPRGLTVLNPNGSIFSQQDSGGTDMFLALLGVPGTTSLMLSSHAWSVVNQPCLFGAATIPRGFKMLDESVANFQIDSAWANPAYIGLPALGAGTGAMASCMRAIAGPGNAYFLVGNGLARYNGIDTSWNTQILGNLLRWSEALNTTSAWIPIGPLTTTGSGTVPAGVTGNAESWILNNTGGVGYQAFLQQSCSVAPQATCVFQFYLKKQSAANYPIVQMQFAGSSSGASSGGGGGTAIEAYAWLDPSGTNAPLLVNVSGAGQPAVTMVTAPTDTNWWLVTMSLTNASQDTDLNVTLFPAYSDTWGGASTSVSGSIQVSAPEVIYNYWSYQYVPTTSSPALPTESASNAYRFQGLYKILFDGAADPNFNCCMTYGDDGMAIPFAVDGHGNIYCGGPITSIKDSNGTVHPTTQWMLYKLNSNGQFLAQYNLFDDAVLVARITPYGNLVVGGKFQFYGSYACGRFVMIDPWGNLIRDPVVLDDPVFTASTSSYPDVLTLPGLKSKLLLDLWTDPPSEYVWSNSQGTWVQAGSGGFTQLPPVTITASPNVPPNLWVPGESGFDGSSPLSLIMSDAYGGCTIWYTLDGSDPRITTNPARTMYPWNASAPSYPEISSPTIVTAYATLPGYANSVLTTVTYGQQLSPPVISPASANINFPVAVTITGPVGAAIWYTTDGSDPTTSGTAVLYSTGFNIGTASQTSAVVRAVAKQAGYFPSTVAQANYGENIMPALTFTPAGGAGVPVNVTIALPSTFTAPYTIYYTTSVTGSPATPTLLSTNGAGPLTLNLTVGTAILAFAAAPGWVSSPIASAAYGLAIANGPVFTLPPAGSGLGTVIISAGANGPPGQSIVYTVNGGAPITALSPVGVDLSDVPGVNNVVTLTAYSTYPGWTQSPTTTQTTQALLLSGLIDVNFAPPTAPQKVGRMAIFSNPFTDIWNTIGQTPGLEATLQENFYAGGTGTATAPGAATATQLSFTPTSGNIFGEIPFIGDNAYANFLEISATSPTNATFSSVAYGTMAVTNAPVYMAVTNLGQIYRSTDGINWTIIASGYQKLRKVVFMPLPGFFFSGAAGVFVIVGSGSTVLFSYDTLTFTPPQYPPISSPFGNTITVTGLPANMDIYDAAMTYYQLYTIPPSWEAGFQIIVCGDQGRAYYATFEYKGQNINWQPIPSSPTVGTLRAVSVATASSYSATPTICLAGDAGEIYTTSCTGTGIALNALTRVPDGYVINNYTALASNDGDFVGVGMQANGSPCTPYNSGGTSGALPSGTTNLFDITPYQYGFIAVGDLKILWGQFVGTVLNWTDITPTGSGSSSSGGGSWGSVSPTSGIYEDGSFSALQFTNTWPPGWPDVVYASLGYDDSIMSFFSDDTYQLDSRIGVAFGSGGVVNIVNNSNHSQILGTVNVSDPADDQINIGAITYTPGGSSGWGSSSGDTGPEPFNYKGVTVGPSGKVVICGDEGIIYGSYNGSIWVWNYSNQQSQPPSPASSEVLRGTFTGLTPGFYDLLIYGHGSIPLENSAFHAYSDGLQVKDINGNLAPTTASDGTFQNTNWEIGRQYVEFSDIETDTGTIAFGVAQGSGTGAVYSIATVQWTEYGTSAGGFTLLGASATAVTYSTTSISPGISAGSEIVSMAIVGYTSASSGGPAGTTLQRSTTRSYYLSTSNSYSGFINAVQLSRRSGAGVRMGVPAILPESGDNLPFPLNPGGQDLMGIFLSPSDVNLGLAPIAQIYYSIVPATWYQYESYLTGGYAAAGISPDPTASTGLLYQVPVPIADNGQGVIVRAIAVCVGRTTSKVAVAFYWPKFPESSSWGQ